MADALTLDERGFLTEMERFIAHWGYELQNNFNDMNASDFLIDFMDIWDAWKKIRPCVICPECDRTDDHEDDCSRKETT